MPSLHSHRPRAVRPPSRPVHPLAHARGAATLVALLGLGHAQILPEIRPKNSIDRAAHVAPAFGDLDGDGRLDLVHAFARTVRVYRGLPSARFAPVVDYAFPFSVAATVVSVGDLDGDADLDLYVSDGNHIRLLRNDGAFTFTDVTAASLAIDLTWPVGLLPRDVDLDGDVDLLGPTNRLNIPNVLWLNDGTGRLTDVVATHMPPQIVPTQAASFADVDADGDPDIVLATTQGAKLLRNDGTGRFADVTATTLPPNAASLRHVAVGDVDGDGDVDVVTCPFTGAMALYLNSGAGTFTDGSAGRLPAVADVIRVHLRDLDGDGAAELVVEASDFVVSRLYTQLLHNDGTGRFTLATATRMVPPETPPSTGVAFADVDASGRADMFVTRTFLTDGLYLNDGTGRMTDVWAGKVPERSRSSISSTSAAMFDMDRDGDLDVVAGSAAVDLLRNDGHGRFTDVTASSGSGLLSLRPTDVAVGDVDGDGDQDLVVAPAGLWLNDGTGRFTDASTQLLTPSAGHSVDLGDADGDGDLDLLLATRQPNQNQILWRNDGTGRFLVALPLPANTDRAPDARFVDIDGDGDRDIVVACLFTAGGSDGQNRIFVNDGTGQFTDETAARLGISSAATYSVAAGDLDGDGDGDLVFGLRQPGAGRAYLNDGSGRFILAAASWLPFTNDGHEVMHLFDADGDGDLDLVASSLTFGTLRRMHSYENRGNGFVANANLVDTSLPAYAYASGDVDGDRDIDLYAPCMEPASPSLSARNRVFTNTQRQLEVPVLAYTGGSLDLAHYARRDPTLGDHVALAFLGAALLPVPVPLPYGTLFVDPSTLLWLPFVTVPAATGLTVQSVPVPANPGLVGLPVHLQAATFAASNPLGTLALTNAVNETFR